MMNCSVEVDRADLRGAREVMEIALGAREFDSFQSWRRALVDATKALLKADRGGFLMRAGRQTRWLADDPRPHLVDAGISFREPGANGRIRTHAVAVAATDVPGDGRKRVLEGLGLSWRRSRGGTRPEICLFLLHRHRPAARGFGERERSLLELMGPAIRSGLEDARRLPAGLEGGDAARRGSVMAGTPWGVPSHASLVRAGRELGLTPRQAEVAFLMSLRRSHKEIAGALGISANTARRHEEGVLRALGVKRRTEVLSALTRHGPWDGSGG